MLRHSEPQKPPTTIEISIIGTKLWNRNVLLKVALALMLVSSAVGSWLTLEGIGAARFDLALAKWVHFLALSVLVGSSAWGAFHTRRRYNEQGVRAPIYFLGLESSRFAAIQEYAVVALLASGAYVLVGYSLYFGGRYEPWYNGLVGLQGLLLLVLAAVVWASNFELQVKGLGFPRLTVLLSLLSLLLVAALDVIPYLAG